jgi:GNAT superfamily N-acetyltransferase
VKVVPAAETDQRLEGIWPEFLLHDAISNRYWDRLYTDFADFQFVLVDGDDVIAEGNCIPVAGQPAQWRDAFLSAFERPGTPDRVCALAILISPDRQGGGLSATMLDHMRGLAAPFGRLVAPVRPTLKHRYPLIPIEDYAGWRRPDGTHFDPWIRTHERLGARLMGTAEEAMLIEGSPADWLEWTGLELRADGDYVVPGALVPVHVEDGHGVYREPCVWLRHDVVR